MPKKVQLPFVMGVMSDLAGKSEAPQPSIADRKFMEIDVDNGTLDFNETTGAFSYTPDADFFGAKNRSTG